MPINLRALYFEYLGHYKALSLATSDRIGNVDCATVCFAFDEKGTIYFASEPDTVKVKNLRQNKSVALTFNDGGKTMCGLQIRGEATEIVQPSSLKHTKSLLVKRNSNIKSFFEKPHLLYFHVVPTERFILDFSWGVDWKKRVP